MFYYSYQHDSSRVKEVDCMNDLFCAAEQVKNINYVISPFSPEKQMKIMLVITSFGKCFCAKSIKALDSTATSMESFEPFGGSDSTFISQLSPGVLIMISPEGSTLRDETLCRSCFVRPRYIELKRLVIVYYRST